MALILPPWVKPAGAALALVGAFYGGWTVRTWKAGFDGKQALEKAAAALHQAAANIGTVAALYEGEKALASARSIERQTELRTIYHETTVPAECAAPAAARGVLDNAVRDANARAAGQPGAALPGPAATP